MWIERTPVIGDTVKIEFAEFTNKGTKIGVYERDSNGWMVIDFGRVRMYLDRLSSFLVYQR